MHFNLNRISNIIFSILLLLPVFLFVLFLSLLIVAVDRFNPFFVSTRIGKNGRKFKCYKLQTLRPVSSNKIVLNSSKNKSRLTKLGTMLRNHGWDELPQIFNIIKGDMGFIGPRPILDEVYKDMINRYPSKKDIVLKWKKDRLKYEPGLSGWHQVNLTDHNIIKYDYEYFGNFNLRNNFLIILKSILILFFGKNVVFQEIIPSEEYVYYI